MLVFVYYLVHMIHIIKVSQACGSFTSILTPYSAPVLGGAITKELERRAGAAWLLLGDGVNHLLIGQVASDPRKSIVPLAPMCGIPVPYLRPI